MNFQKIKDCLSICGMTLFIMLVLPGLNPLGLFHILAIPKAYADCEAFPVTTVTSHDPNDKLVSLGFGTLFHILSNDTIEYTIRFENDKTATASAQLVTITDPLSSTLDYSTFTLGDMEFSNHHIDVPPGHTYYKIQVDLRPEGNNLLVEVEANFDPLYGLATWTFSAIDPATGKLTEDPLAGFLPPNGDNHKGEGYVKLSISPYNTLSTGTVIDNTASIVFDWNPLIDTPRVFNTIDDGAPESHILTLPAQSPQRFTVSWTGQDDPDGSGLASYDIYVSENGSPYTLWLKETKATSALFPATGGNTYSFYSIAKDYVGNKEESPTEPDAFTTARTNHPPSSPLAKSPSHLAGVTTPTPTLSIFNSTDQDGDQLTYEFEIYEGQHLNPPALISANQVPEGETITSWLCELALTEDTWYSWRARAFDGLAYGDWMEERMAFYLTQEKTIDLHLSQNWNLISLPVEPIDKRAKALFPEAQAVFRFTTKYVLLDPNSELQVGKGYWLYLPEDKTYTLTGLPINQYEVPEAKSGWSMIGSGTYPAYLSVGNGNLRAVFGFGIEYEPLQPGQPLEPGKGYWINLSEPARVIVERGY